MRQASLTLRRGEWRPEVGQQVLIKIHYLSNAPDNFAAQLAPKNHAPCIVSGFKSPVISMVLQDTPRTR